ncbi:MAG TPA: DUF3090 family protein [Acidimicrobiales bacterium]|nr:DUF3090 family protein [Acidimicrobiales bacterium]
MSTSYEFSSPDKVTIGTLGPVGARAFYLQAREATSTVTLKVEKQQVGALSTLLGRLLADLARPGELDEDDLELDDFDEPDFVVGALAVSYDADGDRIVVLAEEIVGEDDEPGAEASMALTREQAGTLAIRGTRLVEAGRPPCPLCGFPLDPRGHACPRTNGHHPPLT